jgi:hypothetical protein
MSDQPAVINSALQKNVAQRFVDDIRKKSTNGTKQKRSSVTGPRSYRKADDTADKEVAEEEHSVRNRDMRFRQKKIRRKTI